jgi:hypothetical protein
MVAAGLLAGLGAAVMPCLVARFKPAGQLFFYPNSASPQWKRMKNRQRANSA